MITITGISSMEGDTGFQIVYFDLECNGGIYHWKDYSSHLGGEELLTYLEGKREEYEADIDEKEATWATHPKMKKVTSLEGTVETVTVAKDEIVRPHLEQKGKYLV